MSSGFWDMWAWKATQKLTLKPREALHYHSPWHLWVSFPPARPSNGINRVSLMTGIAATHMPESIGCSPAVSTCSSAGNEIGPGTSALQWPRYALVILRRWQNIFTVSGHRTPPPVHTAMMLTRRQSTWCYSVQHLARRKVQCEPLTPLGLLGMNQGGSLAPLTENETERWTKLCCCIDGSIIIRTTAM